VGITRHGRQQEHEPPALHRLRRHRSDRQPGAVERRAHRAHTIIRGKCAGAVPQQHVEAALHGGLLPRRVDHDRPHVRAQLRRPGGGGRSQDSGRLAVRERERNARQQA
jgi:hypothetical protein